MNKMRKLFLGNLLAIAIVGCATTSPDATSAEDIRPAREDGRKQLAALKKQIQNSPKEGREQHLKALALLKEQEKGTELEPEIEWFSGQEAMKAQAFEAAGLHFLKSAKGSKGLTRRFDSCQLAASAHEKGNLFEKAIKGLNYCIALPGWEKDQQPKLILLQSDIYIRSGDKLSALKGFVEYLEKSSSQSDIVRTKALQLVQDGLGAEELKSVGDNQEYGFLRAHAWYRLGNLMTEQRRNLEAIDAFRNVIALLPGTEMADQSQQNINQIESMRKVSPTTVGAVLPLSGKNAQVGERVLRGLQLGLGLNGNTPSPFKLAVVDDENNPDISRRAVGRLVREDNVIAIVGSLTSKTAGAVASEAQSLGVPSIALSQKAGITDVGPLVFRNALTSDAQVRHLVRLAMNELGIKRFAIMYPNDKFGTEYANIFWDEVLARGGEVRAVQIYDQDENNFKEPIQRLIGTFYTEDRADEYKASFKSWTDSQPNKTARTEVPDDLLAPALDFEALFIADGVKALGQIAPMLSYYNVRGITILGPSMWNTDAVIKRTGGGFNRVLFVDNVQATDQDVKRSNFIRDYQALYNELPGAFEIQGFDSALTIRQMLLEGADSREELSQRLQGAPKIDGVLGELWVSQREISRPIMSLTVENNAIVPFSSVLLKQGNDSKKQ